jgi:serine/threonine protein kinase
MLTSDKELVKLADFGLARTLSAEIKEDFAGTPFYMAPEMFQRMQYDTQVTLMGGEGLTGRSTFGRLAASRLK